MNETTLESSKANSFHSRKISINED